MRQLSCRIDRSTLPCSHMKMCKSLASAEVAYNIFWTDRLIGQAQYYTAVSRICLQCSNFGELLLTARRVFLLSIFLDQTDIGNITTGLAPYYMAVSRIGLQCPNFGGLLLTARRVFLLSFFGTDRHWQHHRHWNRPTLEHIIFLERTDMVVRMGHS